MSQCEDVELKDLVTEALERNGVLARIRAQLRANVFMTLENENGQKHQNVKLKNVLENENGCFTLILIQELLEFCDLIQTSSVFKSETGQGKNYIYDGRHTIVSKHLKFANVVDDLPVLVQLVQLLFQVSKLKKCTEESHIEDKSFESETGHHGDTQNNTFVVNSGRSDNYDLSFASDADSSASSEDKKKITTNSTTSSESISTELNDKKDENHLLNGDNLNLNLESLTKQDGSRSGSSVDSSVDSTISEVVTQQIDSNSKVDDVSDANSLQEFVKLENKSKTDDASKKSTSSSSSSYSKYLKEKQNNASKINEGVNKQKNVETNDEPVDIVMRHVIQSRIHGSQAIASPDEESLSEELQAFSKSDKNNSDDSNGLPTETSISIDISDDNSLSPIRNNILDETIPESPKTKKRVSDGINSLKMQSLRITDNDEIIFSDGDIKLNFKDFNKPTMNNVVVGANNERNKMISKQKNDVISDGKTSVIVSLDGNKQWTNS